MALALDLHKDIAGRPVNAKHDRQAGHPFTTDNCNLGLTVLATPDRHNGGNPALGEEYSSD